MPGDVVTCPNCGEELALVRKGEKEHLTGCEEGINIHDMYTPEPKRIIYENSELNIEYSVLSEYTTMLLLKPEITRYLHTCQRCNAQWIGLSLDPPFCPHCRSRRWRGPDRRRKGKG